MQKKLPNICKKKRLQPEDTSFMTRVITQSGVLYKPHNKPVWFLGLPCAAAFCAYVLCQTSITGLTSSLLQPCHLSAIIQMTDGQTVEGGWAGGATQWRAVKSKPHSALHLSRGEHDSHPSHDSQIKSKCNILYPPQKYSLMEMAPETASFHEQSLQGATYVWVYDILSSNPLDKLSKHGNELCLYTE